MTFLLLNKRIILIMLLSIQILSGSGNDQKEVPATVESVDLEKYVGKWYEIARIPNRFQDQCARNTTAEYSINDDGEITVINSCVKEDDSINRVKGVAKIVKNSSNTKLKVSFFSFLGIRPFWGDYWIIGLAEDYSWAVIGGPERKYGWILARQPYLEEGEMNKIIAILRQKGYHPDDFQKSVQDSKKK